MTATPSDSPVPSAANRPIGEPRSWILVAVLSIVTCGIYLLWWDYKTFEELKQHNGTGIGGVVALIIGIFVGIVNCFLLPVEIKNMYEADGKTSPVTWVWGLWVLVPLVGFFVWVWKMQETLNEYWVSKGAPAPA